MYIFLCVMLVLFSFFVHEIFGHANAMREAGVGISKIAFGLPHGPKIVFPLRGKWKGTDFVIHYLLPIGGYCESDEEKIRELPYWQQSRIYASGPIATIIFGFFLMTLARGIAVIGNYPVDFHLFYFGLAVLFFLAVILQFGGKLFFAYVMPILPVAFFVFVLHAIFFPSVNGAVVSPLVFIDSVSRVSDLSDALFIAGFIASTAFGFPMLLPLRIFRISLDGKQILQPLIEKYFPKALDLFESFGTIAFGLLIIYTLKEYSQPIFFHLINNFHP